MFPIVRLRRLRKNEAIRSLVRETEVDVGDLIYPLFVIFGKNRDNPIASMPGVSQLSVDRIVKEARECIDLGITSFILFGIPETKDEIGSGAFDDLGVVQQAVRVLKEAFGDTIVVVTDVCMCEYTSHGHCGIIKDGDVDNDATLEFLTREALSHARAGADIVAPSDMMDGRVGAIRNILDANGFGNLPIMSYAVKFASAFYGPFRDAAESTPSFGDRRSYQMDPANSRNAMLEARYDVLEGADILMVKPALPYLDIIAKLRMAYDLPIAAYNVSGEYSMIKYAAEKGLIDGARAMMESLTSIKRAGADIIITYFAKDFAKAVRG